MGFTFVSSQWCDPELFRHCLKIIFQAQARLIKQLRVLWILDLNRNPGGIKDHHVPFGQTLMIHFRLEFLAHKVGHDIAQ